MTDAEFNKGIVVLQGGILRKMTAVELETWRSVLVDLSGDLFLAAVYKWLRETESNFPSVGAIVRHANELVKGKPMTFDEAFERIRKAAKQYSLYKTPEQNREIIESVPEPARSLWRRFGLDCFYDCNRDVLRSNMMKAYKELSEQERRDEALPESLRPKVRGRDYEVVRRIAGGFQIEE